MLLTLPTALVVGHSIQGRPIELVHRPGPGPHVLVVGCIHGNECAALPVARALAKERPRQEDLWIVPNLNPDGYAHGTRGNARGVDLNRNFPSNWARIGRRGDPQWSGPHPLSEPESRLAARLVRRIRPAISIWFHQPQAVVRAWGRSRASARRYAQLAGMRYRSIRWPYGTASNWQNHLPGGGSSFVVELPPGPLSPSGVDAQERAVLGVAGG